MSQMVTYVKSNGFVQEVKRDITILGARFFFGDRSAVLCCASPSERHQHWSSCPTHQYAPRLRVSIWKNMSGSDVGCWLSRIVGVARVLLQGACFYHQHTINKNDPIDSCDMAP